MEMVKQSHPRHLVMAKNGAEVICEVLFTFQDAKTDKLYVVFTDHTTNRDGSIRIYAAVQEQEGLRSVRTAGEDALVMEALEIARAQAMQAHDPRPAASK